MKRDKCYEKLFYIWENTEESQFKEKLEKYGNYKRQESAKILPKIW